jgi:uncharacterized protein YbjT (DUF2867 family)
MTKKILVVGGTGKTGRRVAERLEARGLSVRVGSRSAEPAFDWEDPGTWSPAVRGVGSAYIAYSPDYAREAAASGVWGVVGKSGGADLTPALAGQA